MRKPPPLPSHDQGTKNIRFYEQMDFSEPRGNYGPEGLDQFIRTVRNALSDICHRFGINISYGYFSLTSRRYSCHLELTAGEWRQSVYVKGKRSNHPAATVCKKILRLALRDFDQLG